LLATGTTESAAVQSFEVMPNPFHAETMFRFGMPGATSVQLIITDVNGRPVTNYKTIAHEGLNTIGWKGQSDAGERLAPGVYFARLQTDAGSIIRKIILQ
jgi:flagellar hook assembly protein FlgD